MRLARTKMRSGRIGVGVDEHHVACVGQRTRAQAVEREAGRQGQEAARGAHEEHRQADHRGAGGHDPTP